MPFIQNFQIGLLSKEEQHPVLRATVVVLLLKEEVGHGAPHDCPPSSKLVKEEEVRTPQVSSSSNVWSCMNTPKF